MNRGISSSGGRYCGGGGRNELSSWSEDRMSYVNTNKRSSDINVHDTCRCRTGDYIVKVWSEDGMRNNNGCLNNICVERDMENNRGYDGESRRSNSLRRCGGEGG